MKECHKVFFANEKFAQMYIDKLKKTSKRTVKPIRSYLCPKCLLWHLTSSESTNSIQLQYKENQINKLKTKVQNLQEEISKLIKVIKNQRNQLRS